MKKIIPDSLEMQTPRDAKKDEQDHIGPECGGKNFQTLDKINKIQNLVFFDATLMRTSLYTVKAV
jgi:hypothetical protein